MGRGCLRHSLHCWAFSPVARLTDHRGRRSVLFPCYFYCVFSLLSVCLSFVFVVFPRCPRFVSTCVLFMQWCLHVVSMLFICCSHSVSSVFRLCFHVLPIFCHFVCKFVPCCIRVVGMLFAFCVRVVPVLLPCCPHFGSSSRSCYLRVVTIFCFFVASMWLPCCFSVASVLFARCSCVVPCCLRVVPVLVSRCSHVACMLRPSCAQRASIALPCCIHRVSSPFHFGYVFCPR